MYVNVNAAGDWLQDSFDFGGAVQVASSRSRAIEVWRLVDGKLVQVQRCPATVIGDESHGGQHH